jgi:phage head maturation protease
MMLLLVKLRRLQLIKKVFLLKLNVSEAAERTHGVQTLIKDGALKSFSVGFRVKDGKYNREDDSMILQMLNYRNLCSFSSL